jgi:hypothetical protein
MTTFIYRCPTTGLNVQGWVADDPSEGETHQAVTCLMCGKIHIVNPDAARKPSDDSD